MCERPLAEQSLRVFASADGDTEKAPYMQAGDKGSGAEVHEGVGDPFTYRKRQGAFSVSEWLLGILLPIFVVLLGALGAPPP